MYITKLDKAAPDWNRTIESENLISVFVSAIIIHSKKFCLHLETCKKFCLKTGWKEGVCKSGNMEI